MGSHDIASHASRGHLFDIGMTLTDSGVMCISAKTNGDPLPPLPLSHTHTHVNSSSDGDKNGKEIDCCIFSVEEELRFLNRFEEGYDLYDPKYLA